MNVLDIFVALSFSHFRPKSDQTISRISIDDGIFSNIIYKPRLLFTPKSVDADALRIR